MMEVDGIFFLVFVQDPSFENFGFCVAFNLLFEELFVLKSILEHRSFEDVKKS